MAYSRGGSNNFAEYQLGEGFSHAVSGNPQSHGNGASFNGALNGLNGYTSIPSSYAGMMGDVDAQDIAMDNALDGYERFGVALDPEDVSDIARDETLGAYSGMLTRDPYEVKKLAQQGALLADKDQDTFLGGFGEESSIANLVDMQPEDDAFAGYIGNSNQENLAFDGYGSAPDAPLESFHTYFHIASKSTNSKDITANLAKAVEMVPDTTPASVKEEYYRLAKDMLKRKKATQLPALDVRLAEIESNIGWLVNPGLPKTGGFTSMINKAVSTVGSKLAKDGPDYQKMIKGRALGKRAQNLLKKRSGFGGYGFGEGSNTVKYLGFGVAGLVAAGLAWHFFLKKPAPVAAMKNKRRKK